MNKFRIAAIIFGAILVIFFILKLNFKNIYCSANTTYLNIAVAAFLFSLFVGLRWKKKK